MVVQSYGVHVPLVFVNALSGCCCQYCYIVAIVVVEHAIVVDVAVVIFVIVVGNWGREQRGHQVANNCCWELGKGTKGTSSC
jgi:hypothetical protein